MVGKSRLSELNLEGSHPIVARAFRTMLKRYGKHIHQWYVSEDGREIRIVFQEFAESHTDFVCCWEELNRLHEIEVSQADTVELPQPDVPDWHI